MFKCCINVVTATLLGVAAASAQTVISAGAGSYASFPPASAGGTAQTTSTQALYVVSGNTLPVPSNKWWTDLVVDKYAGNLWAAPLAVSANAQGINIYLPNFNTVYDGAHSFLGVNFVPEAPLSIQGQGFSPADSRALSWGDWTVAFRMQQTTSQFMDVTIGHGLPYTWIQFTGVSPQIVLPMAATYFDDSNNPVSFPVTTNHFGLSYSNKIYGIFAPDNTQFTLNGNAINVTFAGSNTYLVVGGMPASANLAYFSQYAYAVPTNSVMNWAYDPAAGAVTTSWHLATQSWKGTNTSTIQGWIPHHWRNSNNFVFNGIQYWVARGLMKCTTGTDFQIVYKFNGIPPTLPAPATLGLANDYNAARMTSYLTGVAANTSVAADTYDGGRDMFRYAQNMAFASQLGQSAQFATLENTLRTALTNWYTYTPASDADYFAVYPAWKALVGFPAGFGSDQLNDQHFHYGYFAHATALLGMYDRSFVTNYGPMATLVAKEYANWDRSDTNFPFLRTFDIWAGYSRASGFSDAIKGNNQESSGEAMNSWGGLFLLGSMLGNTQMRDAGAMGYAMESEGTRQYYFNVPKFYNANDSNWPSNYTSSIVGILWDSGQECQTYFGSSPVYVHGIQWLPASPVMQYQAEDPAFTQRDYTNMLHEYGGSVSSMGSQWGNFALSYAAQFDPNYVAAQMDQLWTANDPVATDVTYAPVTYYQTHALRKLGGLQWQFHMDVPTSAIYYNTNTAQYNYVAYNPQGTPQVATVYSNGVAVGKLALPAFTLVTTNVLVGTNGTIPLQVVATSPLAGQTGVAAGLGQILVTFNQNVSAASLATATMTGAGVTGLAYSQGDGTPQVIFTINGAMQPSQTYAVTIPAAATVAGGTNTLGSNYSFNFTTAAPPPPLAVVTTLPAANQTNVSPGLGQILVTFNQAVSAASLATATMTGSNVTGLAYSQGDGTTQLVFNITGTVQPSQTYAVTIPAAATVTGGTNTLGTNYTFGFTTAAAISPATTAVLNPGFEMAGASASLATNWTVDTAAGGPVYGVRTNNNPHSGLFNFEVHLASTGAGPLVEFNQGGIPVTGGTAYSFVFYADALAGSAGYNATWRILWNVGGDTGFTAFTPGNNAYGLITNSVTAPASATSATVYFHFAGAASLTQSATVDIDDVSLSTTNVVIGGGGLQTNVVPAAVQGGVGISWLAVAGTNYVVQSATNLPATGGWTNLSPTILGNGTTNQWFDPSGSNQQRYYRVQQSP